MCETDNNGNIHGLKTIPVEQAVGTVLAHDITEIIPGDFKGAAFRKGHIIKSEDVCHLQRLGKNHLFVLNIADDEMHEDDAAYAIANALIGEGVEIKGEPKEGKINLAASRDGLLKINKDALLEFNMLGDVMCATLHNNTVVKKGQTVAGTRAIPLVVKKMVVEEATAITKKARNHPPVSPLSKGGIKGGGGVIEVKELRKPKAGVVITGNEVYYGKIKDAFAPVITKKIKALDGEITGIYYAPDDAEFIKARLNELITAGADLLITTGGMSVDPDDVTRFAIKQLGAADITYGSAVLPGAMFLIAYVSAEAQKCRSAEEKDKNTFELLNYGTSELIPVLGIPACGMYHRITIFDLILPRVLAGEKIGRKELSELGHGGLCLNCKECKYPLCQFGK